MQSCCRSPDHAVSRRGEIEVLSAQGFSNLTGVGSWTRVLELAALADVAFAQNYRGLGASLLDLLSDWSGLFLQVTLVADSGRCDLYLGKSARLLGNREGAVRHLESALRMCEDAHLTTWTVATSAQLSGALAERRTEGDAGGRANYRTDVVASPRFGPWPCRFGFDPRLGTSPIGACRICPTRAVHGQLAECEQFPRYKPDNATLSRHRGQPSKPIVGNRNWRLASSGASVWETCAFGVANCELRSLT